MIEVAVTRENRRRWNIFLRRRFLLRIPTSWSEVTPMARRERWWRWASTLEGPAVQLRILRDLMPWRWRRHLNTQARSAIVTHLEWVMPQPDAESIPLESFYHRGTRYHFPTAKGPNVSCVEFALADDYYKAFAEGDTDSLLRVSACLWREEDQDERGRLMRGDARVLLHSQAEVEARVLALEGAPKEVHIQALMWWVGMKMLVNKMYGRWLFDNDDEDEDEDELPEAAASKPSKGPNFGWWGIFLDVAETGVFGPLEKVYQTSIHDICIFLVKKRAEANQSPESPTNKTSQEEED
jgi:hypothetical protein